MKTFISMDSPSSTRPNTTSLKGQVETPSRRDRSPGNIYSNGIPQSISDRMISLKQSPTEPDFVQDPYRFYEQARASGEIIFWEDYEMPVAVSHRAVQLLLRDRHFGRASPEVSATPHPSHLTDFYRLEDTSLLELDGERHMRIRRLVLSAFSSSRIMALSPMISVLADELIDAFPDGPFDFISAFAQPFPIKVISRIIGVPDTMSGQLLKWSNAMVAMYQARRTHEIELSANQAAADFTTYMKGVINERRTTPRDDLITQLIAAHDGEIALSEDEMISTLVLLLNAGHEATVHTLGNGLYTLLRLNQPYECAMPLNIEHTLEEILRFDPPLHLFTRYAYADVDLFGYQIKKGQVVGAALAAANRDPLLWALPDSFDPTRPDRQQVSFGAGPHFCIGAPLARLELQLAFPALFSPRLGLRLAETPRYANLYHFHGLERLMVEKTG